MDEDIYRKICLFITKKFLDPCKISGETTSQNKYSEACDVGSSTLSKITGADVYYIPFLTIYKIVKFEKITLDKFFKEFETELKAGNLESDRKSE